MCMSNMSLLLLVFVNVVLIPSKSTFDPISIHQFQKTITELQEYSW